MKIYFDETDAETPSDYDVRASSLDDVKSLISKAELAEIECYHRAANAYNTLNIRSMKSLFKAAKIASVELIDIDINSSSYSMLVSWLIDTGRGYKVIPHGVQKKYM